MTSPEVENESNDIETEYCEKLLLVKWTVNDFNNPEAKRRLSSSFTTPYLSTQLNWTLACWPRGNKAENSGYVSFALYTRNKISYEYEVGRIYPYSSEVTKISNSPESDFKAIPRLTKWYDLRHYSNLKFSCKISVKFDVDLNKKSELVGTFQTEHLLSSIKSLFKNEINSDVKLIGMKCEIPAHKCILSARSEVFKAMFSSGMKECSENKVKIEDSDDDALEGMIEYIYTGASSKLEDIADKLIIMADKYSIDGLKILCEWQLIDNLSTENIWNYFIQAEEYKLEKLMTACLDLLLKNGMKLFNSEFNEAILMKPSIIKAIINHASVSQLDEFIDLELKFLKAS